MSTVPSLLPQSTTIRSSQNATLSRQSPIFAASLRVMTTAVSCGTIGAQCQYGG
jgi:hypothetical protein